MAPQSGDVTISPGRQPIFIIIIASYQNGRYLFHVSTIHLLTFICVTEDTFARGVAYTFLARVAEELVKADLQVIRDDVMMMTLS